MKALRHKWTKIPNSHPKDAKCDICGITRKYIHTGYYHYYDKFGRYIFGLPRCKSTFFCDKF